MHKPRKYASPITLTCSIYLLITMKKEMSSHGNYCLMRMTFKLLEHIRNSQVTVVGEARELVQEIIIASKSSIYQINSIVELYSFVQV